MLGRPFKLILSVLGPVLFLSISCGGSGGQGPLTINSSLSEDSSSKSKAKDKAAEEKEKADKKAADAAKKAESAQKAQTRKLIQNTQDKISRLQADAGRYEQIRDSLRTRRDGTKSELAKAQTSQQNGGTGGSRKTKEQLQEELKVQEAEIIEIENQIYQARSQIKVLEKEIDELTKQL